MKYTDADLLSFFLPRDHEIPGEIVEEHAGALQTPVVERIRNGLYLKDFVALQNLLNIPEEALGKYLGMSNATLHRRKKGGKLTPAESERLVRFIRLFGLAMGVFDTKEAARSWLKAENVGTAGETPLSYADTEFGAREVENLLGRIEYGVF